MKRRYEVKFLTCMRNTIKLFAAALFLSLAVAACNTKPAENAETDGKDSITTETTAPADTVAADTTQTTPADTTAN